MNAVADICIIPLGVGVSVSEYVVACQKIFQQSGLEYQMHSYGTNVEGKLDEIMEVVKQCHEAVHTMGAPRISTNIRLGTRTDKEQTMQDKIDSVNAKLTQK